jgi:hypothetical protein
MTASLEIAERVIPVWGSQLDMTVQVAGEGPHPSSTCTPPAG